MKKVLNMLKSLLFAVLGVRKAKDAENDFAQFDYRYYVIAGIIVVIVIISILILIVKIVIPPM